MTREAGEILFELERPGLHFHLKLHHPTVSLGVIVDDEGLAICHGDDGAAESPHYIAKGARPKRLRIFLDYGSIEVFADRGRWAGTKRISGFEPVQSARLIAETGGVLHATVWALKP